MKGWIAAASGKQALVEQVVAERQLACRRHKPEMLSASVGMDGGPAGGSLEG